MPRTAPNRLRPLALTFILALLLVPTATAFAQDTDDSDATAEAARPIISTQVGEVPTFGASRPGPVGRVAAPVAQRAGVAPVAIQVEKAQIAADIETLDIVDGVMQNPTGPFIVSWYQETARPGEVGNIVMAGHVDYWNVGPAVFYNLDDLVNGDRIDVTGEDGAVYTYEVEANQLYENASAPIPEIVGGTGGEELTLITCGGEFEPLSGEYLSRRVVRATRIDVPAEDIDDADQG